MIEGLKVTITGNELRNLCVERAEWHADRAAYYERQKEALPTADEDTPEFSNVSKRPDEMLRDRVQKHRTEQQELRFIAAHIDLSENYLLDRNDLHKIGIISSAY